MPCRVDDEDWKPRKETRHGMAIDDFEAVLCGLFTALEGREQINDMLPLWLSSVDWKEAGIKRKQVETWWRDHKAEDERRRKREKAEKRTADLRLTAISKLSPDELAALGIKW
jgi:hypothetical protein